MLLSVSLATSGGLLALKHSGNNLVWSLTEFILSLESRVEKLLKSPPFQINMDQRNGWHYLIKGPQTRKDSSACSLLHIFWGRNIFHIGDLHTSGLFTVTHLLGAQIARHGMRSRCPTCGCERTRGRETSQMANKIQNCMRRMPST